MELQIHTSCNCLKTKMSDGMKTPANKFISDRCDSGLTDSVTSDYSSPESPIPKKQSRFAVTRVQHHHPHVDSQTVAIHDTPHNHLQKIPPKKGKFIVTPVRDPPSASKKSSVKVLYVTEHSPTNPNRALFPMASPKVSEPMAQLHNRIEQAIELVKTHLTLAVRQEFDVMKKTIARLEYKVAKLESENDLLRRHSGFPTDVHRSKY
ncbi:unnamed protein product [Auanema sp. JU1783]|nr:unnamed protein product [Auanema sp. JU1783]